MNASRIVRFVLAAEFLLLVPLIAMQFTSEVDWDVRDFAIVSVLLAGFGFAFSLIINKTNSVKQSVIGLVLAGLIFLVWAELAVGIFGSPFAGS